MAIALEQGVLEQPTSLPSHAPSGDILAFPTAEIKPASTNLVLTEVLKPLSRYYDDTDMVEIRMNEANYIIVDHRQKGKSRLRDDHLTKQSLIYICRSLANVNGLKFDPASTPKLSCVLPEGHRFEALTGNSVPSGISLAIRCKHPFAVSWDAFGINQAARDYLITAMRRADNLIISGATNTGKTTLANLLLSQIDESERVLVMEDTPELDISRFYDGNRLLAARERGTGNGLVDWSQLRRIGYFWEKSPSKM